MRKGHAEGQEDGRLGGVSRVDEDQGRRAKEPLTTLAVASTQMHLRSVAETRPSRAVAGPTTLA